MSNNFSVPTMNRRSFLQFAAHLSAFGFGLRSAFTALAAPLSAQTNNYGSSMYGRDIYASTGSVSAASAPVSETLDHTIYLPLINKEKN